MKTMLYNRKGCYAYVTGENTPMCVTDVLRLIEHNSQTPRSILCGKSRVRELVTWRQVGMYYARKKTQATLNSIGLVFGGRNHASVINGIEQVENGIETNDPQIVYKLQTLPGYQNMKISKNTYKY